ncbi:alkaline shock response membrane anchor protein AmaP [Streptomyces sp. NBC_01619]|uniref:Alkaline shock response membrane anchor protein AmaP n=1 Tax=Streptomyces pratisoli TaxID=3139917 RepID=A0ACC6QDS5_9ACTN|nr:MULTISPECIES: alkaline shock response membrane anchor protein AmaP [unclassified Streptomyces]MCX4509857.1 alkaline shock response membrane anchor protein AmaP [Streptomyces sp. NBC_01619]
MSAVLGVVNRVLLALAGLVLIAVGGAVLSAGFGAGVPSWWPWPGPDAVLLSESGRERWQDRGWWWPAVIAALAVVVLLAVGWFLAQLRRSRLAEVLVDSGDGEGALLRGRALEAVLAGEAEDLAGVARAQVVLHGRRTAPTARVRLLLEPYASPGETLERLSDEALSHARDSAGLAALPAEVRLRAEKHRAQRVT